MRVIATYSVITLFISCLVACSGGNQTKSNWAKSDFHYKLARGHLKDRKLAAAINDLYESLKYDGKNVRSHYLLGFIFIGQTRYTAALKHLRLALLHKPNFYHALNNIGVIHLHQKHWNKAIPIFQKLVNEPLYNSPWLAHNNLAWARFQLGLKGKNRLLLLKAKRDVDNALLNNPKFCVGFNNRGLILEALEEWDQAAMSYQRAIGLCKNYVEPHYRLGALYLRAKQSDVALKFFNKCYKLAPFTDYGQRCFQHKRRMQEN